MKSYKRILIGALGAFTPVLLNLLVADFNVIPTLTRYDLLGYIVRSIVLLFIGGLVGYFNKGERSMIKLFQLGIAAPALITASINAKPSQTSAAGLTKPQAGVSAILPVGFAQTAQPRLRITDGGRNESPMEQFWRGLSSSGIQLGPPHYQIAQYKLILSRLEQEWGDRQPGEASSNELKPDDRYRNERDAAMTSLRQALTSAQDLQKGIDDDDGKLKALLDNLITAQQALDRDEAAHDQALERLNAALVELQRNLSRWFNVSDPKELVGSIVRSRAGLDSVPNQPRREAEAARLNQLLQELEDARRASQASIGNLVPMAGSIIKTHKSLEASRQSIGNSIRGASDARSGAADRIKRLVEAIKSAEDARLTLLDIERRSSEDAQARTPQK